MKEILKVNNLIKKFPKAGGEIDDADAILVLKGINFDVEQGEYVGIMGKSGCGKTTLLKILGFMDQQTDGDVIFDGANTNELWKEELTDIRRRKIGFVFQDFNLMDSLSVKENIMLPVLLDKKEQKECEEKAEALEKQFGIEHLQEKNPYELSGGERQRISIARATVAIIGGICVFWGLNPPEYLAFLMYPAWGALGLSFAWVFFLGLYWRRFNKAGAITSMVTSSVTFVVWNALGNPLGIYHIQMALLVSVPATLIATLLTPPPRAETLSHFFAPSKVP